MKLSAEIAPTHRQEWFQDRRWPEAQ